MTGDIECFIENLIKHFYNRLKIYHILASKMNDTKNIKQDFMRLGHVNDTKQWLRNYLAINDTVNYFEIFKNYIEDFDKTDSKEVMETFKAYEAKRANKLTKEIVVDFKDNGYSLYLGSDIIKKLLHFYDEDKSVEISFIDWLKPFNISALQTDAYYLVDDHVFNKTFVKPILLTQESLAEYRIEKANRSFHILPNILSLYFDYLIVTKRGIESKERVADDLIEVFYYKDVTNYTELHSYSNRDVISRKLEQYGVKPSIPFIELIIDDYGEYYINDYKLKTECDIISFVNKAYFTEELDREAKSFDRKKILQTVLHKNEKVHSNSNYEYIQLLSQK